MEEGSGEDSSSFLSTPGTQDLASKHHSPRRASRPLLEKRLAPELRSGKHHRGRAHLAVQEGKEGA